MSYSPSQPSPAPPLSRATLVVGLYGAMALGALILAAVRGNPDLFRHGSPSVQMLVLGPLIGVAAGLSVVVVWRVLARLYQWARDLEAFFRDLLGALTEREIVTLALASAIGEELLFRGALLPWIGLWGQALLFVPLHIAPKRRLVSWPIGALLLGLGLGELTILTGSLGAPIAAHFMINFCNIRSIVRPVRATALYVSAR
ncbi:MAG: CPBP family glutamic-type intramembrane protease [Kofleriaceae bacterium]